VEWSAGFRAVAVVGERESQRSGPGVASGEKEETGGVRLAEHLKMNRRVGGRPEKVREWPGVPSAATIL
jgi:hypothetical protein